MRLRPIHVSKRKHGVSGIDLISLLSNLAYSWTILIIIVIEILENRFTENSR